MISSLRLRLLLWLLIPLTLYIGVSAWLAYLSARDTADLIQDRALSTSAQVIAGQLGWIDGSLHVSVPPAALELFASPDRDEVYYQVITEHGRLLAGIPDFPFAAPFSAAAPTYRNAVLGGQPIRVAKTIRTMYDSGVPHRVAILVGQTRRGHDRMLAELWRPSLHRQVAMLALTVLLAVIGLTMELRPIIRLKDDVAGRDPMELTPIRAGDLHLELRPVVDAINLCIQRLHTQVAAQKRFIADAAHQLRTPLTLLDTQIQFATQPDDRAAVADVLDAMHNSSRSMIDLTNKLLLLAQAEAANTAALLRQPVDLVAVSAAVLEELAALAQRRDIDLGLEADPGPVWVTGNAGLFSALVMNLVDNAIRYIPSGGKVTVSTHRRGQAAELVVLDNGPGIGAEARARVFERFYRHAAPGQEGTGLGLAIVKEIVAASQGAIELAAGPGGIGLAVCVRLPLAAPSNRGA